MTIQAADHTSRTISEEVALQMVKDAIRVTTFNGQLIAPFTFQLNAAGFRIIFCSFNNQVVVHHHDTCLMMGEVDAAGGLGAFEWVQAGWCWRQAFRRALK